jgi:hypothetical protein
MTGEIGPAVRTWLRYLVPLTVLSAIALAPIVAIAMRARAPVNLATAKAVTALGWELIAVAVFCQLVLVGGAAVIVREQPSQAGALGRGVVQLVRAIVPCAAAAAAIAMGCLALVVPGLVLLVLLAMTGASRARGVPAALIDSIAVARAQLPVVAIAVAGMVVLDGAIGAIAHRALIPPLVRQPAPAQLAQIRQFVHAVAIALVVVSPLPALVLARIYERRGAG